MAFPREFIDELIAKNDIADVVAGYVTLNDRGGRLWGLCPFHSEKTPSFSVNRERQMYYCFGCKEGGGVINFVMKLERLTYPEAVEFLARRVGLEVPAQTNDANFEEYKKLRAQIYELNREAARFFVRQLYGKAGKAAAAYLEKRGISKQTALKFGLGFAPDSWSALAEHLAAKGYGEELLLKSGLLKKKDGAPYDVFRNRVMFPIVNTFSDVIGFGGRVMDDSQPKYLNSPDTAAFNKRKNLYALNLAKEEKALKHAVLVEGYMDVISMYAAGVRGVVASLGTALTPEQAYLLKRYVKNVYVAYDGDTAGRMAAEKACAILANADLNVRVLTFAEGEDPDDFVKANGLAGVRRKMKESRVPTDFKLDMLKREYDLTGIDGRTAYSQEAVKLISKVTDDILKERFLRRVSAETGFEYETVKAQASRLSGENTPASSWNNKTTDGEEGDKTAENERALAAALMARPSEIEPTVELISCDGFTDPLVRKIIILANERIKKGITPVCGEIIPVLDEKEAAEAAAFLTADVAAEMIPKLRRLVKIAALTRERDRALSEMMSAREADKAVLRASYMEKTEALREYMKNN